MYECTTLTQQVQLQAWILGKNIILFFISLFSPNFLSKPFKCCIWPHLFHFHDFLSSLYFFLNRPLIKEGPRNGERQKQSCDAQRRREEKMLSVDGAECFGSVNQTGCWWKDVALLLLGSSHATLLLFWRWTLCSCRMLISSVCERFKRKDLA